MRTKKNIISLKNKTRKNRKINPSLNVLKVGFHLFGAKEFSGDELLEYNKKEEERTHDPCLMQNSSWFGNYEVAKSYKTSKNNIYRWNVKVKTNLVNTNEKNEKFFEFIFTKTKVKLTPSLEFTNEKLKKIKYDHPYLQMSNNEKAFYEFKFAFGYITLKEQFEFLKFIEYLLVNKCMKIENRSNSNILTKLREKIYYYNTNVFFKRKLKYNRLSFYSFDKYGIMNLCKILKKTNYNITGVYQKNDNSFWFPDFVVYKMNITEYILFNPYHNLEYDKKVE